MHQDSVLPAVAGEGCRMPPAACACIQAWAIRCVRKSLSAFLGGALAIGAFGDLVCGAVEGEKKPQQQSQITPQVGRPGHHCPNTLLRGANPPLAHAVVKLHSTIRKALPSLEGGSPCVPTPPGSTHNIEPVNRIVARARASALPHSVYY